MHSDDSVLNGVVSLMLIQVNAGEIGRAVVMRGAMIDACSILLGKLKRREHCGVLCVNGRIILQWILKTQHMKLWNKLMWLSIRNR
jgi:hypothetical protein